MAPITQETVDGLKDIIHKLESRVADLESRLTGNDSKSPSISEQVRIILMGPPGAGAWLFHSSAFSSRLSHALAIYRQGNPGAPDQGQVLRVPFGKFF
jgi:hypothetical protein